VGVVVVVRLGLQVLWCNSGMNKPQTPTITVIMSTHLVSLRSSHMTSSKTRYQRIYPLNKSHESSCARLAGRPATCSCHHDINLTT
jgi:hypothetical protein